MQPYSGPYSAALTCKGIECVSKHSILKAIAYLGRGGTFPGWYDGSEFWGGACARRVSSHGQANSFCRRPIGLWQLSIRYLGSRSGLPRHSCLGRSRLGCFYCSACLGLGCSRVLLGLLRSCRCGWSGLLGRRGLDSARCASGRAGSLLSCAIPAERPCCLSCWPAN